MSGLPDRPTPFTQEQFSETYGGSLICCMFSLPLYGISLLQIYIYFLNYPRDSKWIKLMVIVLGITESVHEWMTCHTVYHYSVRMIYPVNATRHGNDDLSDPELQSTGVSNTGRVVCLCGERHRDYHLLYDRTVLRKALENGAYGIAVLILGQLGFGLYVVVEMYRIWEIPKLHVIVYPGLVPMYVIRVFVDGLTAGVLCTVLHGAQTATDFKGSVRLFRTLMIYAMNRFLLTTLVVIMQTIVLLVRPTSIWAMVMDFITAHLYVNSLLATLNAREHLRKLGRTTDTVTYGSHQATSFKFTSGPGGDIEGQAAARSQGTESTLTYATSDPQIKLPASKGRLDETLDGEDHGVKVRTETFVMSDLDPKRMSGSA
ncbi:hypothetical protein VNI00_014312 [Paramarasmius palmivorus]|uniref:DUF6534 domain-containing protein n=1 Tax=Paramarasmius palmivorus TaxID=297713 RepID=A0AAW0BTC5_9AGAR